MDYKPCEGGKYVISLTIKFPALRTVPDTINT